MLSVLIASHNMGQYLGECLGSVLYQELPPGSLEVVVVDDASTDGTQLAMSEFHYPFVTYYRSDVPLGQSGAKNKCLELSHGEFVFFLDADNLLANPFVLNAQLKIMMDNPEVGFVYSDREAFRDSGERWVIKSGPITDRIFQFNYIDGNMMSRREAFGEYDVNVIKLTDWDRVLHMLTTGWEGIYLSEPMVKYRFHDNNTGTVNAHRTQEMVQYILTKHKDGIVRYGT